MRGGGSKNEGHMRIVGKLMVGNMDGRPSVAHQCTSDTWAKWMSVMVDGRGGS